MIGRALAIAMAALREAQRARLGPLVALLLAFAAPLIVGLSGQDEPTRAWLSRAVLVEGLRTVMPLAVIIGAAFLLKPDMKRGWTVLPARRVEYFAGVVLAGAVVLCVAAGVFTAGALAAGAAWGERVSVTSTATNVRVQRVHEGRQQTTAPKASGLTEANAKRGEELLFELPHSGASVRGSVEFLLLVDLRESPPARQPVELWLEGPTGRAPLKTIVESRHRLRFEGDLAQDQRLVVRPVSPSVSVLASPDRVRVEIADASPAASSLYLLLVSLGGGLVCLASVLLVRALATSTTAVLAGLLVLAAFTMLPGLGGTFAAWPELFPAAGYDEFLAGRAVPAKVMLDGLYRVLLAGGLVPAGALLFKARQIAK